MITARIEIDFEETDNPSAEMVMEYLTALYENDELFIEWLRPQGEHCND
jgi:hypothetical protein